MLLNDSYLGGGFERVGYTQPYNIEWLLPAQDLERSDVLNLYPYDNKEIVF